ncbi:DsbA family protein [Methylocella sp. CPCC 101449]|uniref:DsbA family protein n=1 Tax=Methylocella sp. CPCC 101449 TaxID=2987531 RepID=UPI00288EB00A|nr:DsbA family protein [Methylocella sp. CPCC 101449]MDT2020786.1 DsbA family protein [Methylocella sp. CPCC 101449]HEV2574274.1 DsbA family protein [Beijerinckiaceae bacterium]
MLTATNVSAQDSLHELTDDSGKPVVNYKLPSELSVDSLPGILWIGPESPDVILTEFSDFNCPFCKRAARDLESLRQKDKGLRIGMVQNAVLGLDSFQAARVFLAVLRMHGPQPAHRMRTELFAHRGTVGGRTALDVAEKLKLDVGKVEAQADDPVIGEALKKHIKLSENLGFNATPSYTLNGVGILGYPGPKTVARLVASVRECDDLTCG